MALDRLLRLRRQKSDLAKAEASRLNGDALQREERMLECQNAAGAAITGNGGLAIIELLAQASVHALEARRVARARADLAAAEAVEAQREMRQIEVVVEHEAKSRARRQAGRAQEASDEYAARLRRAAR